MASYSIIIKNGTIFDGSGGPSKEADIGIDDDKIKAIGDLKDETAPALLTLQPTRIPTGLFFPNQAKKVLSARALPLLSVGMAVLLSRLW